MEYHVLIIPVVILAGVGGFYALARTLLANWKAGSKGQERTDASQGQKTRAFEQCYNNCMRERRWDPDESKDCELRCHEGIEAKARA